MRFSIGSSFGALALGLAVLCGCDKLGLGGGPQVSKERPSEEALQQIRYMSQSSSADGHSVYDRLEQARSCADFELAMRWNRPPDIPGGPFNQKLVYLSGSVPKDLPKQSEVFLEGTIQRGEALPSGAWGWSIELKDGSEVQAIEPAEYWQKQEQAQQDLTQRQTQQDNGGAAIVKPGVAGRTLCARGIYQGLIGRSPQHEGNVPLISVLFALDRRK